MLTRLRQLLGSSAQVPLDQPIQLPVGFRRRAVRAGLFWGIAATAIWASLSPASRRFYQQHLASLQSSKWDAEFDSAIFHHVAVAAIFGSSVWLGRRLDLATVSPQLYRPRQWCAGLLWTTAACALGTLPTLLSSFDPEFTDEYPLSMKGHDSPGNLAVFMGSYALHYLSWEGFYRRFLGFGLTDLGYGRFNAMTIQTVISTAVHWEKTRMELLGALPSGILMGRLAYRTESLFWPTLFHFYLGALNSSACAWQRHLQGHLAEAPVIEQGMHGPLQRRQVLISTGL